jgi:hypothetical protein
MEGHGMRQVVALVVLGNGRLVVLFVVLGPKHHRASPTRSP